MVTPEVLPVNVVTASRPAPTFCAVNG